MPSSIRFDVARPERYDTAQLVLRLVFMVLLGVIGAPLGWVFGVLYLALPLLAATVISASGAERYHRVVGPLLVRGLRWLLGLYAYLGLLTDRLPLEEENTGVEYRVTPGGAPTVSSALWHLVTSIPVAIALWFLGTASALLWLVASVSICLGGTYPQIIFDVQRGILRMFATFVAHHASLVEGAAPLRFETGPDGGGDELPVARTL